MAVPMATMPPGLQQGPPPVVPQHLPTYGVAPPVLAGQQGLAATQQGFVGTQQAPAITQQAPTGTGANSVLPGPGYSSSAWTSLGVTSPVPGTTFGMGAESRFWWRLLAATRRLSFLQMMFVKYIGWLPYIALAPIVDPLVRYVSGGRISEPLDRVFYRYILRQVLLLFSRYFNGSWLSFWSLYFLFADPGEFHRNFYEAWLRVAGSMVQQADDIEYMLMFIDHDQSVTIPFPNNLTTDSDLLVHLSTFYYYLRTQSSVLEVLSGKAMTRIDVLELYRNRVPGAKFTHLELGYYGAANRNIYAFKNPSSTNGSLMLDSFRTLDILARRNQNGQALNVVRTFNTTRISTIVMAPFVLSLLISAIWPIVAVSRYHADVQASVQTSFTVGSYVVTAGALLVALAAFADSTSGKA